MKHRKPTLDRRKVVADILVQRGDALVVTGLGAPTWDTAAAGDHELDFTTWGGMGGTAMIGLGLALAQPRRRVLVITGDGEMLMGIGSLGVVSAQGARNLSILVLDNESFGETGRQTGLTSDATDLCAVARGFGIARTMHVTEQDKADELAAFLFKGDGPCFAVAKIGLSEDPWARPIKDGAAIARRMRIALGIEPA
jgi:phosphonopyruvate decarboxylase